jgi:hypothetical protein
MMKKRFVVHGQIAHLVAQQGLNEFEGFNELTDGYDGVFG